MIDEGANHQLFEGRVWESVRLAQGHHKGIRVTSATTLMYSHGRGARGAVAGLDISRRVVTHVAQTGKTKRLPMLIPLIIHILPYRPHPTDPCLCNPASTRSPPPLVIISLQFLHGSNLRHTQLHFTHDNGVQCGVYVLQPR